MNSYTGHRRIDSATGPAVPWAVYLAGDDRRFRLLCFDLDAKTAGAAGAVERDAAAIATLLQDAGLGVVVCRSGPSGGRHVWTALAEAVDAATVATLARLARHVCSTLDIAPLTNPATGCVRPPGAPHRAGGHSTVISGDLSVLTHPSGTAGQVRHLVEALAQLVDAGEPAHRIDVGMPIPVDEHGRLYLPGPRRELPAASAAALSEDAACGDASAVLWRVLIGAAGARWRYTNVAALAGHCPGMEHVRTCRDGAGRTLRERADAERVLKRQWDKAVRFVAENPRSAGDDPTFDGRADRIAAVVRAVQKRADAARGRWTQGGGPADRRILDVLCLLALQAVTATVEADIRRLALMAGIGRETARTALWRLDDDGWIAQARLAEGTRAAHWTIEPQEVVHTGTDQGRSQADPRPVGAGSAERTLLLNLLALRAEAARHDLFTHGAALGHHAGNLYARTTREPQDLEALAGQTGRDLDHTADTLVRLVRAGVLIEKRGGWCRPVADYRGVAAKTLGVDGRLTIRACRYRIERELWAWWQAEQAWRTAPRRTTPRRRPAFGQLALVPEIGTHTYGPHPTGPDGRLSWRKARQHLETITVEEVPDARAAAVA